MSRCQGRLCETKLYGKSQNNFFFYLGMTPNQHLTQLIASYQDNLLRGIVNWSGSVCSDLINSFSNNFSSIQNETKISFDKQYWPYMVSIQNIILGKFFKKDCNFKSFCPLIKTVLLSTEQI